MFNVNTSTAANWTLLTLRFLTFNHLQNDYYRFDYSGLNWTYRARGCLRRGMTSWNTVVPSSWMNSKLTACDSNSLAISSAPSKPVTWIEQLVFKHSTILQNQICQKTFKIQPQLLLNTNMWSTKWCHFQWPWVIINLSFKVMVLLTGKYLKIVAFYIVHLQIIPV